MKTRSRQRDWKWAGSTQRTHRRQLHIKSYPHGVAKSQNDGYWRLLRGLLLLLLVLHISSQVISAHHGTTGKPITTRLDERLLSAAATVLCTRLPSRLQKILTTSAVPYFEAVGFQRKFAQEKLSGERATWSHGEKKTAIVARRLPCKQRQG